MNIITYFNLIEWLCVGVVFISIFSIVFMVILDKWFMTYRCIDCQKELDDYEIKRSRDNNAILKRAANSKSI